MDKNVWLIRTKDLFISRPLTEAELIKKIEKGDLNPLDEVCSGNGYWFGLREADEVRKHLGDIDLSRLSSGVEIEITSATETSTIKKTLILEAPKAWKEEPKAIYTPPLNPVNVNQRKRAQQAGPENERHWAPAIIFGAIFIVTLIFLWMNSD